MTDRTARQRDGCNRVKYKVGDRINKLTIVGRTEPQIVSGIRRRLWVLECDCGKVICKETTYLSHSLNSCGCEHRRGKHEHNRLNLTGKRFGSLTAVELLPDSTAESRRIWRCLCDCGNTIDLSTDTLNKGAKSRLNCGKRKYHINARRKRYPPTPNPYPSELLNLLHKYYYLLQKRRYIQKNLVFEEECAYEIFVRACWIAICKRASGEIETEKQETYYIKGSLRYAQKAAIRSRYSTLSSYKSYSLSVCDKIEGTEIIGDVMTKSTLPARLDLESQPKNRLSKPQKRLKFWRC